jgi:hypothetical protein
MFLVRKKEPPCVAADACMVPAADAFNGISAEVRSMPVSGQACLRAQTGLRPGCLAYGSMPASAAAASTTSGA